MPDHIAETSSETTPEALVWDLTARELWERAEELGLTPRPPPWESRAQAEAILRAARHRRLVISTESAHDFGTVTAITDTGKRWGAQWIGRQPDSEILAILRIACLCTQWVYDANEHY
jgi:hypothetical protein